MTLPRNDPYLQPLQYAVAGATSIPCTKWARRVEIWEDGSETAFVGLSVLYPNGTRVDYTPSQQPIVLGDRVAAGSGSGRFVGRPPQTDGAPLYAGDIYVVVSPLSGTAVVNVAEYD